MYKDNELGDKYRFKMLHDCGVYRAGEIVWMTRMRGHGCINGGFARYLRQKDELEFM